MVEPSQGFGVCKKQLARIIDVILLLSPKRTVGEGEQILARSWIRLPYTTGCDST